LFSYTHQQLPKPQLIMKKTQTHFPGFILTIFLILFQLKSFAKT